MKKYCLVWTLVLPTLLLINPFAGTPTALATEAGLHTVPGMWEMLSQFWQSTGITQFVLPENGQWTDGVGRLIMIAVGVLLLYLAIAREFEPLLLLPIGFGSILSIFRWPA